MRNNQDRTAAIPFENFAQSAQILPRQTEIVQLPSKGVFYQKLSTMSGISELEIKEMTTSEEDILSNESYIRSGVALDRLLKSVLINKLINVNDLLPCDYDALLIKTRITGYGSDYPITSKCPKCGSEKEHEFNAEQLLTVKETEDEEIVDGCFSVFIKRLNKTVTIKALTVGDLAELEKQKKTKREKNLPETNKTDQLVKMIVSIDGNSDYNHKVNFVTEVLKPMDSRFISERYNEVVPKIQTATTLTCKNLECQHQYVVEVPVTVKFFWPY